MFEDVCLFCSKPVDPTYVPSPHLALYTDPTRAPFVHLLDLFTDHNIPFIYIFIIGLLIAAKRARPLTAHPLSTKLPIRPSTTNITMSTNILITYHTTLDAILEHPIAPPLPLAVTTKILL